MKFCELNMKPELLKAVDEIGYVDMTPIQEETWESVLKGEDLMGLAKTGSGKTGACALPLLQTINSSSREIQAIIVVPTRELCLQYTSELDRFSRYMDVEILPVYGGVPIQEQQVVLKQGVQILVATPGRLIDHIYSTGLSFREVKTFVLDEADELLNMGFEEDIRFIFSCLVHDHQTLLFSATMPKEIEVLTENYLKNPKKVKLIAKDLVPSSTVHYFWKISHKDRISKCIQYLRSADYSQVIIFCNSRRGVETCFERLKHEFNSVEYIHGGLPQAKRTMIFERVKRKKVRILLATDVAGRGLDFSQVTHVLNYDFPMDTEGFTHRTGRTGRMGRKGETLTLVTARDLESLDQVVKKLGISVNWYEAREFQKVRKARSYSESGSEQEKEALPIESRKGMKPGHKPSMVDLQAKSVVTETHGAAAKKKTPRFKPQKDNESLLKEKKSVSGGLFFKARELWRRLFS